MISAVAKTLGAGTAAAAPAAVRVVRPGWRDPRLWLGVAIVAVCVIVGARLLAGADDTVEVWALRGDHAAGSVLRAEDLTLRRVRFADAADLGTYMGRGDPLPARIALVRGVGAGELLPRGAVSDGSVPRLAQLPVAVDAAGVPAGLGSGAAVDVYVVGRPAAGGDPSAGPSAGPAPRVSPVLAGVTVLDVAADDLGGPVTLTVAVPPAAVAHYFARLAAVEDAVVTVVGRP